MAPNIRIISLAKVASNAKVRFAQTNKESGFYWETPNL